MYAPHTQEDIQAMLATIGAPSLEKLSSPPKGLAIAEKLGLPPAMAEADAYAHLLSLAERNEAARMISFLGAGAYRHYQPPAVPWFATRSEFLTAYTPYQAEASQGTLQAIFEWQTYISLLTGMDVSNASLYDGGTALVEGVMMAMHANGRRRAAISRAVHPLYRAVLQTYADGMGIELVELPVDRHGRTALAESDLSGAGSVVIQSPNFLGCLEDQSAASKAAHAAGAISISVTAEALSLAVLRTPREGGADIALGEAQSFGLPLGYGGPYVGFIATTKEHVRRLPGRLVGETKDIDGRRAFVLTLQGREQHIRRELATSNICTNQALCALMATVYLATVGSTGLRAIAEANLARARELRDAACTVPGVRQAFEDTPFFNEFCLQTPVPAQQVARALEQRGILAGLPLSRFYPELPNHLLVCATELTTSQDIAQLREGLAQESMHAVAAV